MSMNEGSEIVGAHDSAAVQKVLDEAFDRFRADYPEIARTLDAMNVSFAQYLATMQDLRPDLQTITGTPCTSI
jgi:DNA-binding transcriptional LysR family regulator